VGTGGDVERLISKPGPDALEGVPQTGHELRSICMVIDGKPGIAVTIQVPIYLGRRIEQIGAKSLLDIANAHAARASAIPRATARAMSSSASRSVRGGMSSSRSIMVASGPKRRQAA